MPVTKDGGGSERPLRDAACIEADRRRFAAVEDQKKVDATRASKRTLAILKNETKRMEFVRDAHREVQQRRNKRKEDALREALLVSRDAVLEEARQLRVPKRQMVYPRLSSDKDPPLAEELCCQTCLKDDDDNDEDIDEKPKSTETAEVAAAAEKPKEKASEKPKEDMVTVRIRSAKNRVTSASVPARPLEGAHEPLPKSSATIFLKTHYATEDEQNLTYVPYFGDDDREDVVSELYNLDERAKQMEFGPEYLERDTNDAIDETLVLLKERLDGTASSTLQSYINEDLAQVMDVSVDRIHERFKICCCSASASSSAIDLQSNNNSPVLEPKKNSSTKTPLSYKEVMDSYRTVFCRRCFTYDCNMHGNLSKPSLDLQGELAAQSEREGYWEKLEELERGAASATTEKQLNETGRTSNAKTNDSVAGVSGQGESSDVKHNQSRKRPFPCASKAKESLSELEELTPLQKSICERSFLIYQGNTEKMAASMGAPQSLVADFVAEKKMTLKEFSHLKPDGLVERKKKNRNDKTSMKNYNMAWLRRVEDAEIHPLFTPCDHDGPCSEENCSCVQNAFFCTKHCVWGEKSRNFFRGCACKGGKCGTKSCACFAAKRECDPDLCRTCGACTDPPNQPATKQRCRNDNLGMRRHCHLLMAKSTIPDAGWGIFTKHALKKGDFVHEYVGEVISQEEAERRGRIYDKVNRSYLFNLSSDYVVDASRKGNKTRFANHSSKPNCYTKMVSVNGDIRIGLFAKEDIEPQSELFFDYRYDVSMDNALIVKPGKTVDWMKNPKMANKISKKHEGDS